MYIQYMYINVFNFVTIYIITLCKDVFDKCAHCGHISFKH